MCYWRFHSPWPSEANAFSRELLRLRKTRVFIALVIIRQTVCTLQMGHSNYCHRPRSHSVYNNSVWKTIETWVQVIKAPEDERISYRFQSSDLCLPEPIPRHFSAACPWLSPYVWLKFPIRKQNEFQSWDENTFWDCNFMLQMLHSKCCCGAPSWEKNRLCDWGEKEWSSCFQWVTQIHFEFIQSPLIFS